jgi:sec-independent protein translocase protein TatA
MIGEIASEWSIIIILVVVVLVFGSSQLPKLARSLGSAQSEFKKGLAEGKTGDGADADAAKGDAAAKDSDKPSAASG